MKVIGLAGNAGSGKSTIARALSKRRGIKAVDLDKIAWETYRPRSSTYWRLVTRFGQTILDSEGTIDRSRLSSAAFSSDQALADLNAVVHPAVIDQLRETMSEEEAQGTRVLLVEGALLATSPHVDRSLFDSIIWLEASSETRQSRLKAAGRETHFERVLPRPRSPEVMTIDAEGSIAKVVERVATAIETASIDH